MGFFGDLLGTVLQPAGALLGGASQALGIPAPIGAAAGGFLGGKAGDLARRLPFRKGGRVPVMLPNGMVMAVPTAKKAKKGKKKAETQAQVNKRMAKVRAAKRK